jgi:hypothetical protein
MPENEPQAEPKIPPPEPPPPVAHDLRTGTEVHPDVVTHYANYLQGASYNTPYGQAEAPPRIEKG